MGTSIVVILHSKSYNAHEAKRKEREIEGIKKFENLKSNKTAVLSVRCLKRPPLEEHKRIIIVGFRFQVVRLEFRLPRELSFPNLGRFGHWPCLQFLRTWRFSATVVSVI